MPGQLTVCPFCGCGCGLYLRVEEGRSVGVCPSLSHPISQGRLCAKGWHAYELAATPLRLRRPLLRKDGKLVEATWPQALEAAARGLTDVKRRHGPQALAALGSPAATNEANFALMRLARQALGTNSVDFAGRLDLAGALGLHPTASIQQIDQADLLFLIDTDAGDDHPAITARLLRARRRGANVIALGQRHHRLARLANVELQCLPGRYVEVLKGLIAQLQGPSVENSPERVAVASGVPADRLRQAGTLLAEAQQPLVIVGRAVLRGAAAAAFFHQLDALLAALQKSPETSSGGWLALGAKANSRGALEMGLAPNLLSGYQPINSPQARQAFASAWGAALPEQPGLNLWAMNGAVRGLVLMGDDPAFSATNPTRTRELLDSLEFLVVLDSVRSGPAERADVVLPGAAFGEEEGRFTSLEGRVQRVRGVISPPAEAKPNWEALALLAKQLGADFGYSSPAAIMEQIAALTPLYQGISHAQLAQGGRLLSPSQGELPAAPAEAKRDEAALDLPFWLALDLGDSWEGEPALLSLPVLRQEFSLLLKEFPLGFIELNPADAKSLGVRPGGKVKLSGRQGEFVISARLSEEVPAGLALLPFWQRARGLAVIGLMESNGRPTVAPVQVKIEGA